MSEKTLGEVGRQAFMKSRYPQTYENYLPFTEIAELGKTAWQAAAEAIKAAITPCTFPDCLSARTAAAAGEEVKRLTEAEKGHRKEIDSLTRRLAIAERVLKDGSSGLWELADYRDRNVELERALRESGENRRRLTAELEQAQRKVETCRTLYDRESSHTAEAYQRGVVEGVRLACNAAEEIPTTVSVHLTSHDASIATGCKEAIVMAISAASPVVKE